MKKGLFLILTLGLIIGVFLPATELAADGLGYYSWEGEWNSKWGNMVITQNGNQITGTYTHDNGIISGTVSGDTFTGTWSEAPSYSAPNDAGDLIFEMAADGKSFSGRWRYGSSGDWGDWTGSDRKTAVLSAPASRSEPASTGKGIGDDYSGGSTTITVTASSTSVDTESGGGSGSGTGDTFGGNVTITVTSGNDINNTSGSDTGGGHGYICSNWARSEVERAGLMGLIPGGLYEADLRQNITRAEFAALSVRVYEIISGFAAPFANTNLFYDTSDPEVLRAAALGITNGVGSGRFGPDTLLNRQQAAAMLTRSYKTIIFKGWTLDTDSVYTLTYTRPAAFSDDGEIAYWARDSVYFMVANSIINGVGGNMFAPSSNATREQSITIALRMCQNLRSALVDAGGTPIDSSGTHVDDGGTPSTGVVIDNISATGTVNGGGLSISFSGSSGTISATSTTSGETDALTNTYGVEMSDVPTQPMTISLRMTETPATSANLEPFLMLAFPYVDNGGNSGYIEAPVRASVSGDIISAIIDPAEYGEYLERVFYASDSTGTVKDKTPSGFDFRVTGTQLEFWYETNGKFKCYAPGSLPGSFSRDDAQRLLSDLESLYASYVTTYPKVSRTEWPMEIFICDIGDTNGMYVRGTWSIDGATIQLSEKLFSKGYSRAANIKAYATMAHELFHFIQNNYVWTTFAAEWFDEATATYIEYKYGNPKDAPEIFNQYAELIWSGVVPYWTNKWSDVGPNGYGRFMLIDFLSRRDSEFVKKAYEDGGRATASGWEENIRVASGKEIHELVGDFFETYITTDKLARPLPTSTIYKSADNAAMFGFCAQKWSFSADTIGDNIGRSDSTSVSLGRYGARCVAVDAKHLSAGSTLQFTVPAGIDLRAIVFDSGNFGNYKVTKATGNMLNVQLKGHEKLMLLVCDTSGNGGVRNIIAMVKAPDTSGYSLGELFDSTLGADSYTFIYPGGDTSMEPTAVTKTYSATYTATNGKRSDAKLTLSMTAGSSDVTITCSDPSFNISGSYNEKSGIISGSEGSARIASTWGGFGMEISLYDGFGSLNGSVSMAGGMWAPVMP